MAHEIGKRTKKKFLFKVIYVLNHNPTRVYYMARNRIYILKKYHNLSGVSLTKELFGLFKRTCGIMLYEKQKLKKLYNTFKGIVHGIFMK